MSRESTRLPQPYVKWAFEPPRAEDVPHALARAINLAGLAPRGPTFVSVPMEDWLAEVDPGAFGHYRARTVDNRAAATPEVVARIARALEMARRPLLVAGPDIDAGGGWGAAVELAERGRLAVMASPASGGGRLGFPENHQLFQGLLPLGIAQVHDALVGYDFVLVVGSSVFPYFLDAPGELLPPGTNLVQVTADPDEAARAPMGEAIVADPALTLRALAAEMAPSERELLPSRSRAPTPPTESPVSMAAVLTALDEALPEEAILVAEAPSASTLVREHIRRSRPGTYYYIAGGGLGWGLSSAVGVALARPDLPVVCLLGEGSAQYTIQGLWSAVAYRVPITYVVMRNDSYAILKYLCAAHSVTNVPALDLPGLDTAALAEAYGLVVDRVDDYEQLRAALAHRIGSGSIGLIEIRMRSDDDPGY
jgi:benzoylformate decarboxylase